MAWARPPVLARAGDFDGVLVVAHQEVDRVPLHSAKSSLHVGSDLLERRADVRTAVGIVDRRGESIIAIGRPSFRSPMLTAFRTPTEPFLLPAHSGSSFRDQSTDDPRPTRGSPIPWDLSTSTISAVRSGSRREFHRGSALSGSDSSPDAVDEGMFREPDYQSGDGATRQPNPPSQCQQQGSGSGTSARTGCPSFAPRSVVTGCRVVCASVGCGVDDPGPNT